MQLETNRTFSVCVCRRETALISLSTRMQEKRRRGRRRKKKEKAKRTTGLLYLQKRKPKGRQESLKVVIWGTTWSGWFTLNFFSCSCSSSLSRTCTLFYSGLLIHTPTDIIMCHVIVTCRSMLWTLLSIAAAFSELIAFLSTDWLVGFPRVPDTAPEASTEAYRPTLGLFGRCVFVGRVMCGPYALTFNEIASGFWKAAAIFLATGILLLSAVAFTSIFTICFQSIMRKSIFNVCGLLQGIAGTQHAYTHIKQLQGRFCSPTHIHSVHQWD